MLSEYKQGPDYKLTWSTEASERGVTVVEHGR